MHVRKDTWHGSTPAPAPSSHLPGIPPSPSPRTQGKLRPSPRTHVPAMAHLASTDTTPHDAASYRTTPRRTAPYCTCTAHVAALRAARIHLPHAAASHLRHHLLRRNHRRSHHRDQPPALPGQTKSAAQKLVAPMHTGTQCDKRDHASAPEARSAACALASTRVLASTHVPYDARASGPEPRCLCFRGTRHVFAHAQKRRLHLRAPRVHGISPARLPA